MKEPKESRDINNICIPYERLETGFIYNPPTNKRICSGHSNAPSAALLQDTWHQLAPELHVCDDAFVKHNWNINSYKPKDEHRAQMHSDGFLEIKDIEWGNISVKYVASAIANLVRHGWPPIFVIVYDEVWLMALKFIELLKASAHPKLEFNMDFWAWYINPLTSDKGWGPHRDRYTMPFEEMWISLTDSTTNNGCIYVVPASWDDNYYNSGDESSEFDCQDLRPLPTNAGEALAWSGRVIHFGGRAAPTARNPRISVAFAASVAEFEDPTLRLGKAFPQFVTSKSGEVELLMPTLVERLGVVAAQVYTYDYREPLSEGVERVLEVINQLFEEGL